jgi:hypothetical protein
VPPKIIQSSTFQGGLVTLQPAHLLVDGQTPNCQNIDFSTSLGRLTKRKGHSLLVDGTGQNPATGLHEYIKADGTTLLYEVIGPTIYEVSNPNVFAYRWIQDQENALRSFVGNLTGTMGATSFTITFDVATSSLAPVPGLVYRFWGFSPDPYSLNGNTFTCTANGVTPYTGTFSCSALPSNQNYNPTLTAYISKEPPTANRVNLLETNFTTFKNFEIAVSPSISTMKSSGGVGFTFLLGSPPSNAKFIESHKGRVFIANSSAGKSRLHFCHLNDPEDWTTIVGASTDPGFIDVGLDDGDTITGIKTIGSVLLIFKNTSTWILSGTNPLNYTVRKISPTIGCVANRTIVACDTFAIFLSNLGVYAANPEGVTMLSYNIKPTLDLLTSTQRAGAIAGRSLTQYWLAIDTNADGACDSVYYLDYVYGVWGFYSNKLDAVYYTRRDGTLLSGGSVVGHVFKHNDTDLDNATAITCFWETPDYDFDDWVSVKHPLDIILCALPISGKSLVINHYVDGVQQGQTLTFPLTASGSQNKIYFTKRSIRNTSYGRYARFRYTNSEVNAPIQIFGYSISAYLDARENG